MLVLLFVLCLGVWVGRRVGLSVNLTSLLRLWVCPVCTSLLGGMVLRLGIACLGMCLVRCLLGFGIRLLLWWVCKLSLLALCMLMLTHCSACMGPGVAVGLL